MRKKKTKKKPESERNMEGQMCNTLKKKKKKKRKITLKR